MRLRDLLDNTIVKPNLESIDKEECFEELIDMLVRSGRISDRDAALTAITRREAQSTTGIGAGCAVPHGRDASIGELCIAVGTSADGIEFDAIDGAPVRIVVLILASFNTPGRYVQALAEVVRLFKLPEFKEQLLRATTPQEMLDAFDTAE